MAEKPCNLLKNGGGMSDIALADTLTNANIDWSNPTMLFDHTNSVGDINPWTVTEDGVVNVYVQSADVSSLEIAIFDNSNTMHLLYAFSQKGIWPSVYTFYVKKGQKYRIHTEGSGGTIYSNKAYFYPFIKDIY